MTFKELFNNYNISPGEKIKTFCEKEKFFVYEENNPANYDRLIYVCHYKKSAFKISIKKSSLEIPKYVSFSPELCIQEMILHAFKELWDSYIFKRILLTEKTSKNERRQSYRKT